MVNKNRQPLLLAGLLSGSLISIIIWGMLFGVPAGLAGSPTTQGAAGLSPAAYLPLAFLPPAPPPLPEFNMLVTPDGGINASTYTPHAFQLFNNTANTARITQVRIDLSTSLLPDIVFDPFGQAGDFVAKDISVDLDSGVGYAGRVYESFHDDGFDELILNFNEFNPGEQFNFSVDVDPTSIRGVPAPGPGESGSVSGLEMVGATVTVTYEGGLTVTGQLWRLPGSDSGAQLVLRPDLPAAPTIELVGAPPPPATVNTAAQTLRISGEPGQRVRVFLVQGALFTAGLPGGGFDIDPYEANSVLAAGMQELTAYMAGDTIDIPLSLVWTQPEGGLNHIVVAFENQYGMLGAIAGPLVYELQLGP